MPNDTELFHPVITLPDAVRAERYARLIGLDNVKSRLRTEAAVLADPTVLDRWAARHHPHLDADSTAFTLLKDRSPLLLFAGDVGSGKSALAESFGCDLAEFLEVEVTLYRLKLTARGSGHVGEMTTLIGEAFAQIASEAALGRTTSGKVNGVTILVVDEADALLQSREATQMHQEDRAGVDAFLAGVDDFAGSGLPLLIVLCTNRLASLDPAIKRRAAAIFQFSRPDDRQRQHVLAQALAGFDIGTDTLDKLVTVTGERGGKPGFTYSDLTQRLIPTAILSAYPDRPVTPDLLLTVAGDMEATPRFRDEAAT